MYFCPKIYRANVKKCSNQIRNITLIPLYYNILCMTLQCTPNLSKITFVVILTFMISVSVTSSCQLLPLL